mgnify:CR=1 FL=1
MGKPARRLAAPEERQRTLLARGCVYMSGRGALRGTPFFYLFRSAHRVQGAHADDIPRLGQIRKALRKTVQALGPRLRQVRHKPRKGPDVARGESREVCGVTAGKLPPPVLGRPGEVSRARGGLALQRNRRPAQGPCTRCALRILCASHDCLVDDQGPMPHMQAPHH